MSHFTGLLIAICASSLVGVAIGSFVTILSFQASYSQGTELRQVVDAIHEDALYLRRNNNDVSQYARLMAELYEQRINEMWALTPSGEKTLAEMPSFVPRQDLLDRETTLWAKQHYSDYLRVLENVYVERGQYTDGTLVSTNLFPYLNYMAVATSSGYMRLGDFQQVTKRLENYLDLAPRPDPLSRVALQALHSIANRNS